MSDRIGNWVHGSKSNFRRSRYRPQRHVGVIHSGELSKMYPSFTLIFFG